MNLMPITIRCVRDYAKLFTMSDKKNLLIKSLEILGLNYDEAVVYIELLKQPATHLRLSHATGINRTKVYRIVQTLNEKSLVARQIDDSGATLHVTDPSLLEVALLASENKVKKQRQTFEDIIGDLLILHSNSRKAFTTRTYKSINGFKQMLWHELKAEGEILVFGCGTIEALVPDRKWAEEYREKVGVAGNQTRELMNRDLSSKDFTNVMDFKQVYRYRIIPCEVLPLENQVAIYDNTVATYHWQQDEKIGFEVLNASYADMMRNMFEHYWEKAS